MHVILNTQALLIANPQSTHKDLVDLLRRRIDGYITATKYVMIMYNVSNTLLAQATRLTPGKRSPTITNLDDGVSKSVSALVLKSEISKTMDELHDVGATDILVIQVSNSRM